MEQKYPHIFSPLRVGGVVFKNRIFTAPATPHLLQTSEEYPTEQMIAYYEEKARGGSASVVIAGHNMDIFAPPDPGHVNLNVRNTLYHRYWKQLTDRIHFHDAKASLELLAFEYHGLDDKGERILYSTDGKMVYQTDMAQPAIDKKAMEIFADDYADAAEGALRCGFDSLLIHGGHGLFLFRMLSPLFNTRRDEFGGSMENRAKFAIMILDRIRERVGRKLLIEYRVSGSELAPRGGFQVSDCIEFLELLGDRIDIAHVSAGNMAISGTEGIMHPTGFLKPGCNAYLARAVKESGRIKVPVLTLGAFQKPELIEQTLASGGADIVAMARGTISDPEAPEKARLGREDEIIPCIKCLHCLDYGRAETFGCTVNPTVGRESYLPNIIRPATEKKRVAVIGGGPAGMQAAITAARRGHQVSLFEAGDELGGKLKFSRQVAFKYDLRSFMDYQIAMVKKLGVKLTAGAPVTPEEIAAGGYDAVFAALGADALIPPIAGVDGPQVITAEDSYRRDFRDDESVVVIGGGDVGCETALHIATTYGCSVALLEMLPYLARDMMSIPRYAMIEQLRRRVDCCPGAKVLEIGPTDVTFSSRFGGQSRVAADVVIMAAGMKPRFDEAESFRACAPVFRAIGDCVTAKNVRLATRTGFDAAMALDSYI